MFKPLDSISVDAGNVLKGLTIESGGFLGFGELYFSYILEGQIKAWKKHNVAICQILVPMGEVEFRFLDSNLECCKSIIIGESNYGCLTIPPGNWFGFSGLGRVRSLVVNISTIVHDPNECDHINFKSRAWD